MADGGNIGAIVSIGGVVSTILGMLKFWSYFTDRIAKAEEKSDNAQQEAAEAKNDFSDFRDRLEKMICENCEKIERISRDDGEGLAAIRQKINEVELYMRDNFVRSASFDSMMAEIKAGQLRTEAKLDRISGQVRGG